MEKTGGEWIFAARRTVNAFLSASVRGGEIALVFEDPDAVSVVSLYCSLTLQDKEEAVLFSNPFLYLINEGRKDMKREGTNIIVRMGEEIADKVYYVEVSAVRNKWRASKALEVKR